MKGSINWFVALCIGVLNARTVRGEAAAINYRGAPAELKINGLSERTLQIILAPLDETTGEDAATTARWFMVGYLATGLGL